MAKAKINKNLNKIIKSAMHRPISKDGYVLYPKVPGYSGTEEGETQAEQSEIFQKQSIGNYNSPTNIRKLFITGRGVVVQYYSAMVTSGSQTTPKWKETEYKSEDNLFEVAKSMVTYSKEYSRYVADRSINPTSAIEPDGYTVDGKGISIISSPWTCNNIEEIYFDWTLLLSEETRRYFRQFGLYDVNSVLNTFLINPPQAKEIKDNSIITYFKDYNSGGIKDLRKRYPRLKLIAMISNLDAVLQHPNMVKVDQGFDDIEQGKLTWYEVNRNLIGQSNSLVILGDISADISKLNKEFIIKDTMYKFDFEKLKGVIERYTTKIDDYKRQKMYGTSEQVDNTAEEMLNDTTSDIEQKLLEIEQQHGEKVLKNALLYATMGCELSTADLQSIFKEFSRENRDRLANMIKLTL